MFSDVQFVLNFFSLLKFLIMIVKYLHIHSKVRIILSQEKSESFSKISQQMRDIQDLRYNFYRFVYRTFLIFTIK